MSVKANKNGGLAGGKRKYPDEHGYEANIGKGIWSWGLQQFDIWHFAPLQQPSRFAI